MGLTVSEGGKGEQAMDARFSQLTWLLRLDQARAEGLPPSESGSTVHCACDQPGVVSKPLLFSKSVKTKTKKPS